MSKKQHKQLEKAQLKVTTLAKPLSGQLSDQASKKVKKEKKKKCGKIKKDGNTLYSRAINKNIGNGPKKSRNISLKVLKRIKKISAISSIIITISKSIMYLTTLST